MARFAESSISFESALMGVIQMALGPLCLLPLLAPSDDSRSIGISNE
jgi:hypothetical protein